VYSMYFCILKINKKKIKNIETFIRHNEGKNSTLDVTFNPYLLFKGHFNDYKTKNAHFLTLITTVRLQLNYRLRSNLDFLIIF